MTKHAVMNALDQPRTGYTYVTETKPATKSNLLALRDLLLETEQSEAALAVEKAIAACSAIAAKQEEHAVEQSSSMEYDTDAEAREIAEFCSGEEVQEFTQADDDERGDLYTMGMGA
jgi:hypothetical protein